MSTRSMGLATPLTGKKAINPEAAEDDQEVSKPASQTGKC